MCPRHPHGASTDEMGMDRRRQRRRPSEGSRRASSGLANRTTELERDCVDGPRRPAGGPARSGSALPYGIGLDLDGRDVREPQVAKSTDLNTRSGKSGW